MIKVWTKIIAAGLLCALSGAAHSVPTPAPVAPFHIEGKGLFDANRRQFALFGVQMSGLDAIAPTDADRAVIASMTNLTFRVLRQRWNMNCVRLLVSPWIWQRDGQAYLDAVAPIVQRANAEGLVVVLVPSDNARAGSPFATGLPGQEIGAFWTAWATYFKDNPQVVFDLYGRPSTASIPGSSPATHRSADWDFWRNGGTATDGRAVLGMQQLADRIRAAGAVTQFIAAPAFHDTLDFRGFNASFRLSDPNVLYEVHPYFDHALTDAQRDANFGSVADTLPMYAGEFGAPFQEDTASCRSIPSDPAKASDAVSQLLAYLAVRNISWTAASFEPGQLVSDLSTLTATQLDRTWTCGQVADPQPGIGGILLLFLTGDFAGFGSIDPDEVASAAGGPAGPVSPGEVVTFYGELIGPEKDVPGRFDEHGNLATLAGDTRILFDGVPAPIFTTGFFQVTVQVPYTVAGQSTTKVQAFYKDVPSNVITLPVADTAPALFTVNGPTDLLAINQGGGSNSPGSPAAVGSVVVLYATGFGQTTPPSVSGTAATAPYGLPNAKVALRIAGFDAETLYAGAAPGLVGVMQINARVPPDLTPGAGSHSVQVDLTIGGVHSQSGTRLWIR